MRAEVKRPQPKPNGHTQGPVDQLGRSLALPLEPIRCTTTPPCQECHFCLVHEYGEEYWLQLIPRRGKR